MVLVHDTSSQCVLQIINLSHCDSNQVVERTQYYDGRTDRQTHGRTDRRDGKSNYMSFDLQVCVWGGGDNKLC